MRGDSGRCGNDDAKREQGALRDGDRLRENEYGIGLEGRRPEVLGKRKRAYGSEHHHQAHSAHTVIVAGA